MSMIGAWQQSGGVGSLHRSDFEVSIRFRQNKKMDERRASAISSLQRTTSDPGAGSEASLRSGSDSFPKAR
jgi:hypothetical protein